MVEPRFVDARSAKRIAVERLNCQMRGRLPDYTGARHHIEVNVADLVGLDSADKFHATEKPVIHLGIRGRAGAAATRYREIRRRAKVDFFSLDVVEQRTEGQSSLVGEIEPIGPLANEFIRVSIDEWILEGVEGRASVS